MSIIKQIFCTHPTMIHLRDVYGDEINYCDCRSYWQCQKCSAFLKSDRLGIYYKDHKPKHRLFKLALRLTEKHFSQTRWGRKFTGGVWFEMSTSLMMPPVWSREKFTSCQAKCISEESWNDGIKKIDQL